jgi:hypothetical protein
MERLQSLGHQDETFNLLNGPYDLKDETEIRAELHRPLSTLYGGRCLIR